MEVSAIVAELPMLTGLTEVEVMEEGMQWRRSSMAVQPQLPSPSVPAAAKLTSPPIPYNSIIKILGI